MQEQISAQAAAQRLRISVADVDKLVRQGILRPQRQTGGTYLFAAADVARIISSKGPSLSDEAAQVESQIRQEMIFSVSTLQKLRRRLSLASLAVLVFLMAALVITTLLFKLYPEQTSNFFGYYYRYNHLNDSPVVPGNTAAPAAASVQEAAIKTSVVADVLKPIAATSLVMVKAFDTRQYQQIVTDPALASGAAGPAGPAGQQGPSGLPGINGVNGLAGLPGAQGVQGVPGVNGANGIDGANGLNGTDGTNGINGTNGTNGVDGTNGTNGVDGTSVADVTTSPGDLIVRDNNNLLTRLGAGTDNQVLTIVGGIPAWSVISGLSDANLSGAAGISNANLAHSSVSVAGNAGSAAVSLGGTLNLVGAGITSITASGSTLTVSSVEADTLATVAARGATTAHLLVLSGGLTVSGTITLPGLLNCQRLITNGSGVLQCAASTAASAAFTDLTPGSFAANNTTELFNDAAKPNITPDSSTQTVLVSVHVRFTSGGNGDTDAAVRIVRAIGAAASCTSSPQVGDTFSALLTKTGDIQDAAATFLDQPATTSQVFYTVCASTNSLIGKVPVPDRIDVTLVKVGL